jgi:hypothetical protein
LDDFVNEEIDSDSVNMEDSLAWPSELLHMPHPQLNTSLQRKKRAGRRPNGTFTKRVARWRGRGCSSRKLWRWRRTRKVKSIGRRQQTKAMEGHEHVVQRLGGKAGGGRVAIGTPIELRLGSYRARFGTGCLRVRAGEVGSAWRRVGLYCGWAKMAQ